MTKMTASEWNALLRGGKPKAEKEGRIKGVMPTVVDGIKFDSKGEAARWVFLSARAKLGHIKNLRRQVEIVLQGQNGPVRTEKGNPRKMRVDFAYIDGDGREVAEDFKGWETPESVLKRDVLRAQGIEIRVVKAEDTPRDGRWSENDYTALHGRIVGKVSE